MDEIGEMSLRMQAMLLRFLETGEIQRVGSERPMPPLDVRVVAATHRNLVQHVNDKSFREDLYYRLNVIHIEVPPLRERREDLPELLAHFLALFSRAHRMPEPEIRSDALQQLTSYDWPGNVRELKNVAERLVVGSRGGRIDASSLPRDFMGEGSSRARLGTSSTKVASPGRSPAHVRKADERPRVVLVGSAQAVHGPRPDT